MRTRLPSVTLPRPWTLSAAFALLALLAPRVTSATNYVVALLDDVGVDKISVYHEGPTVPPTPNLNALARRGLLFRNAWATPSCSPTRAAVLTGRRGELTGLGSGIPPGPGVSPDEFTIADALREEGYATAAIGKWHLEHDPAHPLQVGFDTHRGARANVGPKGYYNWRKFVDGEDQGRQTQYATTDTAEEAIAWIEQQTGPWFLWLQFNAPHVPLHAPPAHLHTRGDLEGADAHMLYAAMLEATDRELGRVIRAAGDDTTFFVMGDNGTYKTAIVPPFDKTRGKLSVYEGGVQVPLIVAGPDVSQDLRGQESEGLVQASDLFATITALAGRPAQAEDSTSFAPQLRGESALGRTLLYTSRFRPNGGPPEPMRYRRAARDDRFKLVRGPGPKQELYDLLEDPRENRDLLTRPLPPIAAASMKRLANFIDTKEWPEDEPGAHPSPWAIAAGAMTLAAGLWAWRRRSRAPAS